LSENNSLTFSFGINVIIDRSRQMFAQIQSRHDNKFER